MVSEADLASDQAIEDVIRSYNPEDLIFSEERDPSIRFSQKKNYWIIDPLCGTVPFMNRFPTWGISVAYCSNAANSSVAAISCPDINELIHCDGNKVYRNGEEFKLKPDFPSFPDLTLCLEIEGGKNWVNLFNGKLDWIKNFSYLNSFASAVFPGMQVILGNISLLVIYKISLEHVAGLVSIGSKMGLVCSDILGRPLQLDKLKESEIDWFVLGWPEQHEQLMNKIYNK